jgi:hypothetical protein
MHERKDWGSSCQREKRLMVFSAENMKLMAIGSEME